MAGEPDSAASQTVDALGRQVAALARENARLAGELQQSSDDLRQSREYQAAIGEVLAAISRSTIDLAPILQTLADTALRLCEAEMGFIVRRDGEAFIVVTAAGATPEIAADAEDYRRYQSVRPIAVDRGSVTGRVALAGQPVQIPDIAADQEYQLAGATALGKIRTQVGVPLMREGRLVGVLILSRQRVEPFSERQVGLLRTFADQAVIAMENARLLGELRESLDQQTATSDVLRTISRSSVDLGSVLETLVATVARLCRGDQAWLVRRDGNLHHLIASAGASDAERDYMASHPFEASRGNTSGRVVLERRTIHIPDVLADPEYTWDGLSAVAFRTTLGIPLLREDTLVGVFVVCRTQVAPFSDKEIELASGFADQAMIAIENARLFEELSDRQAELRVTLDNTGDGVVMFDADFRLASWNRNFQEMLDIPDSFVAGRPGYDDYLRLLVGRGELGDGDPESIVASHRQRATRQWSTERTRPDGRIIEVRNNPVPDGGAVLIYADITERKRAEAEIAAARDAAEEALEQQTATADILKVIASSPTDLQPVLDAVVKAAVRFCGATDAVIILREGEGAFFAAHEGPMTTVLGASLPLNRETSPGRAILDGRTCHLPDIAALDPVEFAGAHRIAAAHGFRAALAAPLLRQGRAIGSVTLRKAEAGPFTPRQIELLETFAAQAVIAIENVRLFNDLRESLEQQIATADILKVIASSPNDVQPVFDVVVKAAVRLCGAQDSLVVMRDGSEVVFEAHEGPLGGGRGARWPLVGENVMGRAIIEGRTIHVADASALAPGEFDRTKDGVALYGFKAIVAAPLMRKGSAIGALLLRRQEAGAYTPRQIELLETFAAQAVIAIENVRLFTELSDALEQQTATADILNVIAGSPTDVQPVLDAVAKAAVRFCGATDAMIQLRDGDSHVPRAHEGPLTYSAGDRRLLDRSSVGARATLEGRTFHFPDVEALDPVEFATTHKLARQHGFRAFVVVPLMREDTAIGTIVLRKVEPSAFTPQQIQLLETFAAQAVIAIENVRLFNDLRDALEQQTATADILGVISRSPTDVQPVLEAVTRAALRFCGAPDALVLMRDGDDNVVVAHQGTLTATLGLRRPITGNFSGQALLEGRTLQIADVDDLDPARYAAVKELARQHKWRSSAAAPMMHGGKAIGCVVLRKPEPGLLSPRQIALLETFAAQAVIAIENVRLFTELRDALDQQTATADILQVIASSPTDVQPVLEAVTRAALRFCGAPDAIVWLRDGDENVVAAHQGVLTATLGLRSPVAGSQFSGLAMLEGRTRQIADVDAVDADSHAGILALARQHKWRSAAAAPMMHRGKAIGCVVLRKPEPGLLSPRQIALLETFAAQAVIAIENVRLFTELKESLEQQTGTADILKVIASSRTDVQPVLEAVARAAVRFCGAPDAIVQLREGNDVVVAAHEGPLRAKMGQRRPIEGDATFSAVLVDGRTIHYPDVQALDAAEFATWREVSAEAGWRAFATTPLLREGIPIGCISLRRVLPGSFTPQQIELLKTFAAQAVIAIENVRLFTELREALEQQTATAEVLRVISQSPTDVKPVLEAVAAAARRFCNADTAGVILRDGAEVYTAANDGPLDPAYGQRFPLNRGTVMGRSIIDGHSVYVADMRAADPDEYPLGRTLSVELGHRSTLAAPLLSDDSAIGCILLRKPEPDGFTARQTELAETFAAQAVIAIQNVRLFTELRDALDQQSATSDVLKVIASSPTDVQPVLDAVARAAQRFCGAADAVISLREGDEFIRAAHEGSMPFVLGRNALDRSSISGRAIVDGRTTHVPDLGALDREELATSQTLAFGSGARAALAAPMLREGVAIGCILLRRTIAGPFAPKQIELLEAFAAQAVIAIENVRLFTELRDSLDQQTATAEILRVISQSPTDVAPVLAAVVKAALKFCGAGDALVGLRDGDTWFIAAHEGPIEATRGPRRLTRGTAPGRAMVDGVVAHVADLQSPEADDYPEAREFGAREGFRAVLAAPLLRDNVPIGAISLRRPEPGAFTPNQVDLLKSFAAQAVIAIQNVRLFTELRDSLERLKAAQANLIQSEKMASLGQLTAGIAHEIKNPLNFVNNFAALSVELLDELKETADAAFATLDADTQAEVDETMALLVGNLGKIAEHGKRADGIVRSMLSHSRGGSGDWAPSDINALVEEALNLAYHGARAQDNEFNVTLERDLEKNARPIEVVPQDVTRVFLNLLGNGFYAVGKRGREDRRAGFRPTLRVSTRDLGEAVEVRVRDNGTGIPPDVRAKLFQPFFTTKPTGEGTGLGLSISYDIVTQQHGGSIEVESEPGSFTEFTVRLPRRHVQSSERG